MSTESQDPPTFPTAGGRDHPEILVALDHASLVEHLLRRADAPPARTWDSDRLGLTRFRLDAAAVQRFTQRWAGLYAAETGQRADEVERRREEQDRISGRAPLAQLQPVDQLLRLLRTHFADQYAGWVPTMGKNRLVAQVEPGGGTVSHGGGSNPEPHEAPAPRAGHAGEGVVVGVLDTALVAHPAFAGRRLAGADVLEPAARYPFAAGHGTFVSGLVWEQAPGATVHAKGVLDEDGQATSWDVANEIVRLGREGVDILTLAFVCHTDDGQPPLALAAAVDRLDPDVLVVACAGNHGGVDGGRSQESRRPAWPAALDDVVAVGSARRDPDAQHGYTLSGFTPPGAPWVDVVTQGEGMVSTYFTGEGPDGAGFGGGARWSGTSFSTALVSGRVAARAAATGVPVREAYESLVASLRSAQVRSGAWLPPFLDLSDEG